MDIDCNNLCRNLFVLSICYVNDYKLAVVISRATNPSSFKLEFFVNNLSKVGASTFEKLGL